MVAVLSAPVSSEEGGAEPTAPQNDDVALQSVIGGLWGLAVYGYLTSQSLRPGIEYLPLVPVSLLALFLPLLIRAKPRAGGVAAAVLALAGFPAFLTDPYVAPAMAAFWLPGALCLGIASVTTLRVAVGLHGPGRLLDGVGVWPAVLAALGGSLALLVALAVGVGTALAHEGRDPWPIESVYMSAWALTGVVALCAAWLLCLRPWPGIWLALIAVAGSFATVALVQPDAIRVHFAFWGIAATPLLLAAALGARRALARRGIR